MPYRKLTAGRIFSGKKYLVEKVLVTTQTGRVIDLVSTEDAGEDVEMLDGILCPGFINAHCHTELSHMKGIIPRNTGMVPFLMQVMFERQADEKVKRAAIKNVIEKLYENGVVAVGDICNTDDSLAAKREATQLFFHNFIEASGFVPSNAHARFDQALKTRDKFLHYFPISQTTITTHAPYSVSPKLLNMITGQSPAILSIHNQESLAEDDFIRNKNGEMLRLYASIGIDLKFYEAANKSSLQHFVSLVQENIKMILVHNCYTTSPDIEWLHKSGYSNNVCFCLCPNANLYIGNQLPSVTLLRDSGIPICVGTDSMASNEQLSILSELQTLQFHFPFLTVQELLGWATTNGAVALQVDDEFGSFTKGTKPGVLQLLHIGDNDSLRDAVIKRIL